MNKGLFALVILAGFSSVAFAQTTITWDGGGDGVSWFDRLNWSADELPRATNDVVINIEADASIISLSNVTVRSVQNAGGLVISNSDFTVTVGASFVNGTLHIGNQRTLAVANSNTTFQVNGAAVFPGANLSVSAGGLLEFSTLRSHVDAGISFQTRDWLVTGAGSRMRFPALTNIVGATNGGFRVRAFNGGRVEFPVLVGFSPQYFEMYADGSNASIDLPQLTRPPRGGSDIEARNGATISAPLVSEWVDANLVIRGTNSFLPTAQITNLVNVALTADRCSPVLSNVLAAPLCSFYAENGARIAVPGVTTYTNGVPSFQSREFRATGSNSVVDLNNLTNLVNTGGGSLFVRSYGGGVVLLNGLAAMGPSVLRIYAEGAGSQVSLSNLISSPAGSELEARSGGRVVMPNLLVATNLQLVLRGTNSSLDLLQLTSLANSSLTVDRVDFTLSNVTDVSYANLYVENGGRLALPNARFYPPGIPSFQSREFRATGAGSVLDLSSITNLSGATNGFSQLYIRAYGGGQVHLDQVVTVPPSRFIIWAENAGSLVNLSNLVVSPRLDSVLEVRSGGAIQIPLLTEPRELSIVIRGASFIPTAQFITLANSSMTVDGLNITLPNVTDISFASLYVEGGGRLAVPNAPVYPAGIPAFQNREFRATGAGSVLDLSTVTSLSGSINGFSRLYVRAYSGGKVDLRNIVTVPPSGFVFYSEGTGSLVDLSGLASSPRASSTFEVRSGGAIAIPQITRPEEVELIIRGALTLPTTQFVSISNSSITVDAVAPDFSGVTNADLASLFAENNGRLTLPNVTSFATVFPSFQARTWQANGAGSVVEVTNVAELQHGTAGFSSLNVRSYFGGIVRLDRLGRINNSSVAFYCERANSVIHAPALTNWSGNGTVEAITGGRIELTTNTFTLTNVVIVLRPDGTNSAGTVELWGSSEINGNGLLTAHVVNNGRVRPGASPGSITFGSYTQATNGTLVVEVGGSTATNGYDVLNVLGAAALDGQLDVTRINNYAPALGSVHRIVRAGSLAGEFARFTGLNAGASTEFVPAYNATGAELRADFAAGPVVTNVMPTGVRSGALSFFDVQLNEAVSVGSVGTNDALFTGPSGSIPVTSVVMLSGRSVRFSFATQTTPGTYTIIIGPNITDTVGNLMNQDGDTANGEPEDRFTNTVTLSIADLAISNIGAPVSAQPGEMIAVTYTVQNVGLEPVMGSRNDAVFLSDDGTVGGDTLVGLAGFSEVLSVGGVVTVTQNVFIPLLGPAGGLRVAVVLDYHGAIAETSETNNAALALTTLTVPHMLQLQVNTNQVTETGGPLSGLVSRNGSLDSPLTVTISVDATEINMPSVVTIPAGQNSIPVALSPVHDMLADGAQLVAVTAAATGFADAVAAITILDSDTPRLSVAVTNNNVLEGASALVTVTRDVVTTNALSVALASSSPGQLSVPSSVVIAPNAPTAVFTALAVDDTLLESAHSYSVSASAAGHLGADMVLSVQDNDIPAVSLTVSTPAVSEGSSVTLTVTRSAAGSGPVTFAIQSASPMRLNVPTTVSIPAGQVLSSFSATAVDNTVIDGNTNVAVTILPLETLTAKAVPPGAGASVLVTDNDGPTLTLKIARDAVPEGAATTALISRNTAATNDLVVSLTSSDTNEAVVPASIVISNGQASATITVSAAADGVTDGSISVSITGAAAGFASGLDSFIVTDINLPDLVITSLSGPTNGLTGENFSMSFREMNLGVAAATGSWSQVVSLSTDPFPGDDEPMAEFEFTGEVPPGLFVERSTQLRAPLVPGDYWLIVRTDLSNHVAELVEDNNFSATALPLRVDPSFTATVQTAVETALAGTPVPLTGIASRPSGAPAAFELVSIHITVKGTRRIIAALTDANGSFNATFAPLPGEGGSYTIGAAHPGLSAAPVQDAFTLLGVRFDPPSLTTRIPALTTITSVVHLANLADVPLTGLVASILDPHADVSVSAKIASTLDASAQTPLELAITSLVDAPLANVFTLRLSTAQGATTDLRVSNQVVQLLPRLVATPGTLAAGMRRGEQTIVPFTIANVGGAASGPLSVLLPGEPFMHLASPAVMDGLEPGASNVITLQLLPATNQPLGTYAGTLFIQGTNSSVSIPYSIRSLSDAKGGLQVEVVDEYTYYASGAPRVTGAEVSIRDSISGVLATNGVSGSNGLFSAVPLTEGYYDIEVRATNHSTYRATVFCPAGATTNISAFISRQAVRYLWTVEPTEIEDRTRIVVESVFETFVPIPVVTVEPAVIDLAELTNELTQIDLTIANHGLIAAQNLTINFGSHPHWTFTPLIREVGTLAARSSITVPLIVRRIDAAPAAARAKAHGGCSIQAAVNWTLRCGNSDNGYGAGIAILNVGGECGGGGYARPGGGAGGGYFHPVGYSTIPSCRPCDNDVTQAVIECAISFTPFGCPYDLVKATYQCGTDAYANGVNATTGQNCVRGFILPGIGCILELFPPAAKAWNAGKCAYDILNAACGGAGGSAPAAARGAKLSVSQLDLLRTHADRYSAVIAAYTYPLGSDIWFSAPPDDDGSTFTNFMAHYRRSIEDSGDGASRVTPAERTVLLGLPFPPQISVTDVNALCDRWNRTVDYYEAGIYFSTNVPFGSNPDFVAFDVYQDKLQAAYAAAIANEAEGFSNVSDGLQFALEQAASGDTLASARALTKLPRTKASSDGICAQVRLRIEQEAVITRDAFKATLEFINGSDTALQNIHVSIAVRRGDATEATSLFGIGSPALANLNDVSGSGVVLPGTTGSATWTLIPSGDAAPSAETQTYFVSGVLSYMQDGIQVTVPLAPAAIDVLPNPALRLRYFHERDVLSDDPFTTNIVEASQPYSLAVMVQNVGYGAARNVRISSSQPEIIENEKGLLIDFDIIATEVAGQNLSPSLTVNFGDVDPGGISIGRWLLKSTLQGQFVDYSATFEHLDGLGDPRLSLIQSVDIHELIRIVRATNIVNDAQPDFLVNDFADDRFLPDTLYFSDGSSAPVTPVTMFSSAQSPSSSNLNAQFQAPMPPGWSYLRVPDPGNGKFILQRIVRADGSELPPENFWTTDRTFIAGGRRPVYETNLHLLDFNSTGNYTLVYAMPPARDTVAPQSAVAMLPPDSYPNIPVTWAGTDETNGTGIASFDVYVSDNGGPFTRWLAGTTLRGGVFVGVPGHTYGFYTRARDLAGNIEAAPPLSDASTIVNLENTAPSLVVAANQTVAEGALVTLFNSASDADPGTVLAYSLGAGSPQGASINAASGTVTWPTGEGTGPSTNIVAVVVTDDGVPQLSATGLVTVVVSEINAAPVLALMTNVTVNEGVFLELAGVATDADIPVNALTYSLVGDVPSGSTISPTTGIFTWTPDTTQGPSTNRITVEVTDNGIPPLAASRAFTIVVRNTEGDFKLSIGSTNVLAGSNSFVPIVIASTVDITNVTGTLEVAQDRVANLVLSPSTPALSSALLLPAGFNRSELRFSAAPGQVLDGNLNLAALSFSTVLNSNSAVVPLHWLAIDAQRSSGARLTNGKSFDGRVIIIGAQPVLTLDHPDVLTLYGRPFEFYNIHESATLDVWPATPRNPTPIQLGLELFHRENVSTTNSARFFKAEQLTTP